MCLAQGPQGSDASEARTHKIEKIVGCKTIDYLVEDDEFMFILSVLNQIVVFR